MSAVVARGWTFGRKTNPHEGFGSSMGIGAGTSDSRIQCITSKLRPRTQTSHAPIVQRGISSHE